MQVRKPRKEHSARAQRQRNFPPSPPLHCTMGRGSGGSPIARRLPSGWRGVNVLTLCHGSAALHCTISLPKQPLPRPSLPCQPSAAGAALHNAQPGTYNQLQLICEMRLRAAAHLV